MQNDDDDSPPLLKKNSFFSVNARLVDVGNASSVLRASHSIPLIDSSFSLPPFLVVAGFFNRAQGIRDKPGNRKRLHGPTAAGPRKISSRRRRDGHVRSQRVLRRQGVSFPEWIPCRPCYPPSPFPSLLCSHPLTLFPSPSPAQGVYGVGGVLGSRHDRLPPSHGSSPRVGRSEEHVRGNVS